MKIPFNRLYYSGKELTYIQDALNRRHISGDGYFNQLVTGILEDRYAPGKILMTTSATHALEMAVMLCNIQPGDEVIMPSFTFPSTANAVLLRGGRPVFAEVDDDLLNISVEDIKKKITPKTRALIPVHYGGIGCNMTEILEIASTAQIYVIEDAAHAINAKIAGKLLGTWGHFGCLSFHGTKNITCGEGGAIIINSQNDGLWDDAQSIRQKGTNVNKFLAGKVNNYGWTNLGSSYAPADILMAFLYAQINDIDKIMLRRKKVHEFYSDFLGSYVAKGIIKITNIPDNCSSNYHIFYILFNSIEEREYVRVRLNTKGITAVTHYEPLHSSLMGKRLGYSEGDLPITQKISKCLLRLPIYPIMTEEEMQYIRENLVRILEGISHGD